MLCVSPGADVPALGEEDRPPGAPGLGGLVDAEAAREAERRVVRHGLAEQVTAERGVDRKRSTGRPGPGARRRRRDGRRRGSQSGRPSSIEPGRGTRRPIPIGQPIARDSGQDEPIGRLVGGIGVGRVDVDEVVPGPVVIPPEVEEGRAAEARRRTASRPRSRWRRDRPTGRAGRCRGCGPADRARRRPSGVRSPSAPAGPSPIASIEGRRPEVEPLGSSGGPSIRARPRLSFSGTNGPEAAAVAVGGVAGRRRRPRSSASCPSRGRSRTIASGRGPVDADDRLARRAGGPGRRRRGDRTEAASGPEERLEHVVMPRRPRDAPTTRRRGRRRGRGWG